MNTKATEVLYQTVGQLAELEKSTTLVDVCCGLGTIGLCLAKEVKQVGDFSFVRESCGGYWSEILYYKAVLSCVSLLCSATFSLYGSGSAFVNIFQCF